MIQTITDIIRNILGDTAKDTYDIFTFVNSRVFTLSEANIVAVSSLLVNEIDVDMSGNWSFNSTLNKITIEDDYSLTADDTLQINYSAYNDYSDGEILSAIKYALVKLSINYGLFIVAGTNINPEPTPSQQNLIALVASILLKPENRSIRMPDLSITQMSTLSTDDRINKIIALFKQNPGQFSFLQTF